MTDIVERLRDTGVSTGWEAVIRDAHEAAAEIERLREANEMMLTDIRRTDVDMLAFKAEIERLRAGNRDLQLWFDDLKIEYNKLRAALVSCRL